MTQYAELVKTGDWKPYPEDNDYLVSRDGRVFGKRGWILAPGKSGCGYLTYNISGRSVRAHYIVARTWIGPRPDGLEISHEDNDRHNNSVDNLRYVTHSENERRKRFHGTSPHGERNGRAKLTKANVEEIRHRLLSGETQVSLAAEFNVTQGLISHIKREAAWIEVTND
jgi:hypothetical protein